jgi:hypothetical protein
MRARSTAREAEHADHEAALRFADKHGLQHEHSRRALAHQWEFYPFGVGSWRRARNVVHGALHGRSVTAFDYHYALLSDSVDANGYQRDSLNRYLVCVVDLDHAVPDLVAVRTEWLEWHSEQAPGSIVTVDHEVWSKMFTLISDDTDFAQAVVTAENAARCAEADIHAEWRFAGDELLLWIRNGHVDDYLTSILDVALPLIQAAERYPSPTVES